MSLQELIEKDPALRAELEARGAEQFKRGYQSAWDAGQSVVKEVGPVLISPAYPEAARMLAIECLRGEIPLSALHAAKTFYGEVPNAE